MSSFRLACPWLIGRFEGLSPSAALFEQQISGVGGSHHLDRPLGGGGQDLSVRRG